VGRSASGWHAPEGGCAGRPPRRERTLVTSLVLMGGLKFPE
jgi:hypothetical protein